MRLPPQASSRNASRASGNLGAAARHARPPALPRIGATDAWESIKAVSEYLGHADPALTLRVYAHMMPSSRERTRNAINRIFRSN